jgi:hypothetical protein
MQVPGSAILILNCEANMFYLSSNTFPKVIDLIVPREMWLIGTAVEMTLLLNLHLGMAGCCDVSRMIEGMSKEDNHWK